MPSRRSQRDTALLRLFGSASGSGGFSRFFCKHAQLLSFPFPLRRSAFATVQQTSCLRRVHFLPLANARKRASLLLLLLVIVYVRATFTHILRL
jgi:hypothetical protein